MGHIRLGILPKSRRWIQVVNEPRLGAEIDAVAGAAADAAEASLQSASNDFLAPDTDPSRRPGSGIQRGSAPPRRRGQRRAHPNGRDGGAFRGDRPLRARKDTAAIWARWLKWRQSRASSPWWAQICPRCSGRPRETCKQKLGGSAGGDRFSALAREFFARLTQRSLDLRSTAGERTIACGGWLGVELANGLRSALR